MKEKTRILIIDDETPVRQTLRENLEECGFEVREAPDGDEGLRSIDLKAPPHIVITDIIMPRKEGLETIIEIRKKFPGIKLLAISGGGRTRTMDFLELAEKLGAHAILPKPIDMDELEQTVRRLTE